MPAFKKLGPGDQIDNVLVLEPQWTLASGSSGWRGSPEGSASVNLYGGPARHTASAPAFQAAAGGVIQEYQYEPTIPAQRTYGLLKRSNPITASVDLVWMTNEDLNISQRTRTRWGYEHWKTVMGLYGYYGRRGADYTTASYDHYCLYFNSGSTNIVSYQDRTASNPNQFRCIPTGSFTLEAWIKPFVSGSPGNDLTIMSRARCFKFKVDGNSSKLVFAGYDGTATTVPTLLLTGSTAVSKGVWHHVAVAFDGATASLYLDNALQGSGSTTGYTALVSPIGYTGSFHIGAEWGGTVTTGYEDPTNLAKGLAGTVFHGFVGETRVWGTCRSAAQISASYDHRLTGSELGMPLLAQFRLSEGPLTNCVPNRDPSGLQWVWQQPSNPQGSGTINWATNYQRGLPETAVLWSFNSRPGPTWHPNDNPAFYLPKQLALSYMSGTNWGSGSAPVQRMKVINVPEAFHGRQIVPGSVVMTDRSWSHKSYGLVRTLIDDGRGGLFLSGSAVSASFRFETSSTPATGTWLAFPANTSSIRFEAGIPGTVGNSYQIVATTFGFPGDPSFHINETDPTNASVTIPCSVDGFTPDGTAWSFYQFMATSSVYFRPTSFSGNPNDIVYIANLTLGGAVNGTSSLGLERSPASYRGVEWNKVGNVFYEHGLIVIRDPALLDFAADTDAVSSHPDHRLELEFKGTSRVPVKTVIARIDRGELNRSLNPTYYTTQEDGYRALRHPSASLYITTVGLYNSDRELVGVARLAEPLRVRPRDRFAIRIRMDF